MYLAQAAGGYRGVIALHAVGVFVLAILVARSVRRVSSPAVAILISALALVGLFLGSAERPQLISWCLLAATVPALRRSVAERRAPWWFVGVIWIWANLHGLWSASLTLFGALVLGLVIEVGLRAWQTYLPFIGVGLASAAAAMLTPAGPRLLLTPLHVRAYAPYVTEWAPPNLLSPFFGAAYLMLAVLVVGWVRKGTVVPPHVICLVVASGFLGLAYSRTIPVAVIVLAPLAAAAWSEAPQTQASTRRRSEVRLYTASAIAFLVAAAWWLPQVPGVLSGAPWAVSQSLDALPGRATVLNEYDYGGWLLWTARDTSPGIDGRTEIYSPGYVGEYLATLRLQGDWRGFVKQGGFDAAWLRRGSPLVFGLRSQGWTVRYRNDFSIILVPPRTTS
jgi:hypothetical protein